MAYKDLRQWINHLEEESELVRIKEEINLEPDVGAIGRASSDTEGPGILAEKVSGVDVRLSICLHGSYRRAAMAMGLPKDTGIQEQVQAWISAYDKYPVKAKKVSEAPCKENVLTGDKVNLFQFPIPRLNTNDGSFYITKGMCITNDPDTDWVNIGMYRMMVLDRDKTAILLNPLQHVGYHYQKHWRVGKPMEMAVALGTEPVLPMVAGMKIPKGWSEFDYAGAVRGEPEEIIMAESANVPVPATAEIIFEGEVGPELVLEGPFSEHTGAYSNLFMCPTFKIKTITHRDNPIFDHLFCGRPMNENNYMTTLSKVAGLQQELKEKLPQITQVAFLGPYIHNTVIQGKWKHAAEPRLAMTAMWSSDQGQFSSKLVTVVDEDIDPWNAYDVMWAIATRCQADTDVIILPGCESQLDPSQSWNERSCRFGIDATKPTLPYPRHRMAEWVTPRATAEDWKRKILSEWKRGGK